jgi:plastocyanin
MRRILLLITAVAVLVPAASAGPRLVDPRAGGFDVALGEWSVALEAKAIRPGTVTITVVNRGRLAHALRVRPADHSGSGHGGHGGDSRTRVLAPGERATLQLDLSPGTYEVECFVEDGFGDHEDRGMRALLDVRSDAPLVAPAVATTGQTAIKIQGFDFRPGTLRVKRGQTIRWTNGDAAPHTITAKDGSWTSKQLRKGAAFQRRFARGGTFVYFCALHPGMRAKIVVR